MCFHTFCYLPAAPQPKLPPSRNPRWRAISAAEGLSVIEMRPQIRNLIANVFGLFAIGVTILIYFLNPNLNVSPLYWLLFTFLLIITTVIGIPLGFGEVSLVPMVALSSTFVIGVIPTVMAEIFADLLYGLIRGILPGKFKWIPEKGNYSLSGLTFANLTMHVFSLLAAGVIYYGFGGNIPLQSVTDLFIIFGTGATYIVINYLLAGFFLSMRSKAHLRTFSKTLPRMLFYEAFPITFAPLLALILVELGKLAFILVVLSLIFIATLLRDQADVHQKLKRRIQELSSLQAVGQSLTASLDIQLISETIYKEVSKMMPASNFYIALWDPEADEVNFPFGYEKGQKIQASSRTSKRGLTEYVIKTKKPLLIERNVKESIEAMGYIHFGEEALSWLGVPILAENQAIGMIAVQSYRIPDQIQQTFDHNHQEILSTIASQASVAFQNAWLYRQTDKALAQRVQELNSILNTTKDGIMLLDNNLRVIEVNQALCAMLDIAPGHLLQKTIKADQPDPIIPLSDEPVLIQSLLDRSLNTHRTVVTLRGKVEIPAQRTISPVQDPSGNISGWLFVYRDLTEQLRVENLQEDLTRMLVHDLRSPIITIQGGLDMIEVMINDNDRAGLIELVNISRTGSTRMLEMINALMNVTQLESGELTIQLDSVDLKGISIEEGKRFLPVMEHAGITLSINFTKDFPLIRGDSDLLRRVLHNITDNALKFSPDGSRIEIWGRQDPQNPGNVLVGVRDQGLGIRQEDLPRLFEKYSTYQRDQSRRKGTGLGLYFCKLAVEAHNGQIWVESRPGEGSNFIFRIPIIHLP